jgi:hypothetical protein
MGEKNFFTTDYTDFKKGWECLLGRTFGPLPGFRVDKRFGRLRRVHAAIGKSFRVTFPSLPKSVFLYEICGLTLPLPSIDSPFPL